MIYGQRREKKRNDFNSCMDFQKKHEYKFVCVCVFFFGEGGKQILSFKKTQKMETF
jgi:hypothetical protein